jgi:E3 ubiquitin-protein ligase HERC4
MFLYYEESRLLWFNHHSLEEEEMFYLVGLLCGLAIYNSIIISLNFPLVLYRLLLNPNAALRSNALCKPTQ